MYLSEVIKKFTPLSGFDIPIHYNTKEIAQGLLDNPNTIYVEDEGKGCLLGVVYPHYLNPDILVCQELGWWVEPQYRKSGVGMALYRRFEKKAIARGIKKLIMISLETQEPDKMNKLYIKQGFRVLEHTYIKEV